MPFRILKNWGKITQKCLNSSWRTIWKECVVDRCVDRSEIIPVSRINQETLMIACNKFPKQEKKRYR